MLHNCKLIKNNNYKKKLKKKKPKWYLSYKKGLNLHQHCNSQVFTILHL